MRAIAYLRCSTEGQVTEGVSLEVQAEAVKRYAHYKNITITEEIRDEGISGGINKARPGFIQLLDRIQTGDVQAVVLFSLERLSRDMLTLLALERLLDEYDVELHTVDGEISTSDPNGFMNFAMRAFMGEMERRTVKYRTKKAMEHKRGNGKVFNHTPYGYDRHDKELLPNIPEQKVIKVVNEMYQAGSRLSYIVDHLNNEKIPTKQGGRWSPQQVKNLIDGYQRKFKKTHTNISNATRAFIEAIA